jgi:hypothetical protein
MGVKGTKLLTAVAGVFLPMAFSAAQAPPTPVPAGTPVNISVTPASAAAPPVSFTLGPRHGHVTPARSGCTHTGGGNIDIVQPSPDTLVITMTGVAVAYGSVCSASAVMHCELQQGLEISFDNPKVKRAKLTMEGRVIGLLRSGCKKGTAAYDNACASLGAGPVSVLSASGPSHTLSVPTAVLSLNVPPHSVSGGENLSVNDHDGPVSVPITAGKYMLYQTFQVSAAAPCGLLPKGPSAEFAPDPALDPLWISYKEPFHGAAKKDFGFQVTLKVAEDTEAAAGEEKKAPAPGPEMIPTQPQKLSSGRRW